MTLGGDDTDVYKVSANQWYCIMILFFPDNTLNKWRIPNSYMFWFLFWMHNSITFCLFLYQNISCFMCMQMPKLINCIFDIYLPCTTFPQRNNLLWNVKVTFEVKLLLEKVSKTTETWWVGLHQEFITMYFLYQYTYEQLILRWWGYGILFISTVNIPYHVNYLDIQ